MRRKEILRIVIPYICLLVAARVPADGDFHSGSFCAADAFIIVLSVAALLLIVRALYATLCDIRNSNEKFNELWEQDDFDGCIVFAQGELEKDISAGFALNAKSRLVTAYYRIGDNEAGRKLLYETKWGICEADVLYFFVLDCLANNDVCTAKKYYRKLRHAGGDQKLRIETCRQLLSIAEGAGEIAPIRSIYPIVQEIAEKNKRSRPMQ